MQASRSLRWLSLATGVSWFWQRDAARLQVAPERRLAVRAAVERTRADFARAKNEADPVRREELGSAALSELLQVIGRGDAEEPATGDLGRGIELVDASLPEGAMKRALGELREGARANAQTDPGFRTLSELFLWAAELVDTRTERERKLEPLLQRAALGAFVVACAWAVLAPHNVSKGGEVTASSICPVTPGAPYARSRLYRVVDGVQNEATFAICTKSEVHPWVQVDLGKERSVSRVVVYNRTDCCWGVDDTPLSVQVSTDGQNFKTVATRSELIMVNFPWSASFSSTPARYVRITNEANAVKNIVINEIEVYGR